MPINLIVHHCSTDVNIAMFCYYFNQFNLVALLVKSDLILLIKKST